MATLPQAVASQLPGIEELCREFEVRELALFGSALTERFGPESDYDLLVEFQPEARVGLFRFADLQQRLEELLRRKVDLVSKPGLKPFLRESVLGSAEVIYARG